jgi:hypothetical protein
MPAEAQAREPVAQYAIWKRMLLETGYFADANSGMTVNPYAYQDFRATDATIADAAAA